MPHKLNAEHVQAVADAVRRVVMPRGSRSELVRELAEVLEVTTPRDKAGELKSESAFTGRKRRVFEEACEPGTGVEIVVHVQMSSDGLEVLYQDWTLHVWEGHWGHLTVKRPAVNSFAGVVELAVREHFVRNVAQLPIRFEK